MRGLVKYIVSTTYKPLLVKYLSKTRTYSYKGIHLEIPPQVFHPGFFFSTKLLLRYIAKEHLNKKSFLELGAGSGLLSIYAAKKGANVMATDISPIAIECVRRNAGENGVEVNTFHSDLFDQIPKQPFDFILINPPYYKKKPLSISEYAWYCGENGEYFQHLFKALHHYIHKGSSVLMVLCDGCDLQMIKNLATQNLFSMKCVNKKETLIEKNYVFKIQPAK
jgi:release factor glutamine methyltransferase